MLVAAILSQVLCPGHSRAQEVADKESYHRAVEYCRNSISWPMKLSPDARILCFDGSIMKEMNISLASSLNEGGLFVVRSSGGNAASAIALSNLIRERGATVVVYDYCLAACAGFFLIASHKTFVVKGALVAWNYLGSSDTNELSCLSSEPIPGGLERLRPVPCRNDSSEIPTYRAEWTATRVFYKERAINPSFEAPPDSTYVRRVIRNRYAETGEFPDIAWTIHPRHYPTLFKTRIIYEAYPANQEEVDGMASRLRLSNRVIYDP